LERGGSIAAFVGFLNGWSGGGQPHTIEKQFGMSRRFGVDALELLARTGFLVKGLLYIVIGALAFAAATGIGGRVTGTRGALLTILAQPFGRTLLLVAITGLLGYALWRVLQGLLDPDRLGKEWRAIALRVSYAGRGAFHAALGLQVIRFYRGLSESSGTSGREIAAEAFRWPFGDWLVVLAGVALIGFAAQQVWAAIFSRFEPNLDVPNLRRDAGEWAVSLSRFGMAARAVVFAMLGWFVVDAGWSRDSSEVTTTASLMRLIAAQPGELGHWLLGTTAAGFIAYGFYQLVHARYLRIRRVG
jgi:Domain of Unknown Function (DUF1206)